MHFILIILLYNTKWVSINTLKNIGDAIKNKERLACKGYSQGLDYWKNFATIAILEGVRIPDTLINNPEENTKS